MAVFCTKCGKELKEGMKFCDKCGTAVASPTTIGTENDDTVKVVKENTTSENIVNGKSSQETFIDKVKKNPKQSIICAAAIIFVIIVMSTLFGGGSYKTPIKNLEAGINKRDINKMNSSIPDEWRDTEATPELIAETYNEIELTIKDGKKVEKKYMDETMEDSYVDEEIAKQVKTLYKVNLNMHIDSSYGPYETDTVFLVGKIKGKWKIIDLGAFNF